MFGEHLLHRADEHFGILTRILPGDGKNGGAFQSIPAGSDLAPRRSLPYPLTEVHRFRNDLKAPFRDSVALLRHVGRILTWHQDSVRTHRVSALQPAECPKLEPLIQRSGEACLIGSDSLEANDVRRPAIWDRGPPKSIKVEPYDQIVRGGGPYSLRELPVEKETAKDGV